MVKAIDAAQALALRQAKVLRQAENKALTLVESYCIERSSLDAAQAEHQVMLQARSLHQAKVLGISRDKALELAKGLGYLLNKSQDLLLNLDKNLVRSLSQDLPCTKLKLSLRWYI